MDKQSGAAGTDSYIASGVPTSTIIFILLKNNNLPNMPSD
jgi:hypothetical protein